MTKMATVLDWTYTYNANEYYFHTNETNKIDLTKSVDLDGRTPSMNFF